MTVHTTEFADYVGSHLRWDQSMYVQTIKMSMNTIINGGSGNKNVYEYCY